MNAQEREARTAAHDAAVRLAIGDNIRRARVRLLDTLGQGDATATEQRAIAAGLLGKAEGGACSGGTWGLYERGVRLPSDGRRVRMAGLLGIEVGELYAHLPTVAKAVGYAEFCEAFTRWGAMELLGYGGSSSCLWGLRGHHLHLHGTRKARAAVRAAGTSSLVLIGLPADIASDIASGDIEIERR